MTVTFELPPGVEEDLQRTLGDLGEAAKEALLVEGYRTGCLSIGEVTAALGLETRLHAEAWLAKRGIRMNYGVAELEGDAEALDRILGK